MLLYYTSNRKLSKHNRHNTAASEITSSLETATYDYRKCSMRNSEKNRVHIWLYLKWKRWYQRSIPGLALSSRRVLFIFRRRAIRRPRVRLGSLSRFTVLRLIADTAVDLARRRIVFNNSVQHIDDAVQRFYFVLQFGLKYEKAALDIARRYENDENSVHNSLADKIKKPAKN